MTIAFNQIIPILRIFDVQKAKEFYCEFLGFDTKCVEVVDPFGNRIQFNEKL